MPSQSGDSLQISSSEVQPNISALAVKLFQQGETSGSASHFSTLILDQSKVCKIGNLCPLPTLLLPKTSSHVRSFPMPPTPIMLNYAPSRMRYYIISIIISAAHLAEIRSSNFTFPCILCIDVCIHTLSLHILLPHKQPIIIYAYLTGQPREADTCVCRACAPGIFDFYAHYQAKTMLQATAPPSTATRVMMPK